MNNLIKKCLYCENEFYPLKKETKRGYGKFCSRSCSSKFNALKRKKEIISNVVCGYCQKKFYKNPSKRKGAKHNIHFCCRKCKDLAQRIGGIKEIQPFHYGEINSEYREIAFRLKEHKCEKCSYDKYKNVLQVHHKDKNHLNNTIDNLEILCPTCHMVEHFLTSSGCWTKKI